MKHQMRFYGGGCYGVTFEIAVIPFLVLNRLAPVDPLWNGPREVSALLNAILLAGFWTEQIRDWRIRLQNVPLN